MNPCGSGFSGWLAKLPRGHVQRTRFYRRRRRRRSESTADKKNLKGPQIASFLFQEIQFINDSTTRFIVFTRAIRAAKRSMVQVCSRPSPYARCTFTNIYCLQRVAKPEIVTRTVCLRLRHKRAQRTRKRPGTLLAFYAEGFLFISSMSACTISRTKSYGNKESGAQKCFDKLLIDGTRIYFVFVRQISFSVAILIFLALLSNRREAVPRKRSAVPDWQFSASCLLFRGETTTTR